MASPSASSLRPLSVKEIAEQAHAFEWNDNISLKAWMRTAHTLYNEAVIYLREGNFAQAYLLYLRFSMLIIEHLPYHPEAKTAEAQNAFKAAHMKLKIALDNLEKIKHIVKEDYEKWEANESKRRAARGHQQAQASLSKTLTPYDKYASRDPALSGTRLLDAGEHQELAVNLARNEIRRRDAGRNATRSHGLTSQEEEQRRNAGFWNNWTAELAEKQAEDEETFRMQMESTRRRLDEGPDEHITDFVRSMDSMSRDHDQSRPAPAPGQYHYPSVSRSEPVHYTALDPTSSETPPRNAPLPPRPPKEQDSRRLPPPLAPERPAKVEISRDTSLLSPEQSPPPPARPAKIQEEAPKPSSKQQRLTFKPAAYLENGDPIRPIFLPRQLRREFLSIAAENTRRGLEMCGILCGTAVNNALFVRCLLIPEQKCTSDTCETENENSMLDYCMSEDLLILGWIHTHPTQTCFMSSRDLHTQSGYQVMLPESIAIVCAPKFRPSYGVFRLTHPPGLTHVLNCTQKATFHPHAVDNLYTEAGHPPGHVYENDNLEWYIHDLRPGAKNGSLQHKNF
ncbi:hypothetical protein F4780DRAFT_75049 [Xylariomycetidae sp. FL0641]|nr:hypothetical protein F4780DRAFT_75049 [Xylariomycetidae sp. FL0641]